MFREFLSNVIVYLERFIDHILLNKKQPRLDLNYDSQPTKRSRFSDETEHKSHEKLSFASVVKIIESGDSYRLLHAFLAGTIVNVDMGDMCGNTLLTKASEKGKIDCVKVLLEHGAVINVPHRASGALYVATTNQHIDVVKLLLKHGADTNLGQNKPLHAACSKGNLELVKLLMEHGAKLQGPTDDCTSELVEASESGSLQLVEYLVSKGVLINCNDYFALISACEHSSVEMVELLLNHGADVNAIAWTGDSGLIVACERNDMAVIRVLVERGADMTMYNKKGKCPFIAAYDHGNMEAIDLFLERGIDLNCIGIHWEHNGELENIFVSPLMCASLQDDLDLIKRLLAHGADVNMMMQYRRSGRYLTHSPLLFALMKTNISVLKLLLKEGANANLTDNHGDTALLYLLRRAWMTKHHHRHYRRPEPIWVEGVKILLEYGLDIKITNKLGETVFDYVQKGSELDKLLCEVYAESRPALK